MVSLLLLHPKVTSDLVQSQWCYYYSFVYLVVHINGCSDLQGANQLCKAFDWLIWVLCKSRISLLIRRRRNIQK